MNRALDLFRDNLLGLSHDMELKYIAFGDDDSEVNPAQTQLGNERFRKKLSTRQADSVGRGLIAGFISDDEALFHIREIGIFAGDATDKPNSGVMVSRILYDLDKSDVNNPFSFKIERYDTIRRA